MNPFRLIANPNLRIASVMAAIVAVMVSMSFAAVPLYSLFCRVTGFGGIPSTAEQAPEDMLEQMITVRFDATLVPGMPWSFRPVERDMTLHIGEQGLAFYEASNPTDRPVAGQATFNVAPYAAGGYFTKIDCFCFTEQILQPGETVLMPVNFFVDPEILDDPDGKHVHTITLSYTFYEIDLPESEMQAQLDIPAPGPLTDAAAPATQLN